MTLEAQEKISKIMREQADKLGEALKALRIISRINDNARIQEAKLVANIALREISDYGKNPEDL